MEYTHKPVLLDACIQALNIRPDGIYVDGTLGRAGHSMEIARRLTTGRLICIDRDQAAIDAAQVRLAPWLDRVTLVRSNFSELGEILSGAGVSGADGMLFDLGVSSPQLDDASRGFSYMQDAPLDMRMDASAPFTAEDAVNGYTEEELAKILKEYGEERFAKNIARNIAAARKKSRIRTTGELAKIVEESIPAKFRQNGPCARKTFQAIRIEVNGELDGLEEAVKGLALRLKKGGRICILTFHSLEDRIVKNAFRDLATDCICDKSLPVCVCGKKKEVEIITHKPLTASAEELQNNSRAKSAKLRIAERV